MSVDGVTLRQAEHEDVRAIARLYAEAGPEVVARQPAFRHLPDVPGTERRYRSRISDAERHVLVALVADEIVAFADASLTRHQDLGTYHRPGIDVYVEELIVTESKRRHGIGSALMEEIERWAHEVGARLITLDTHVDNAPARALYRAAGYREVGVILMKAF